MLTRIRLLGAIGWSMVMLGVLPVTARAQAIAGVVKDTTGAVLPGVTVEASSPALIEKVRTVVTDDQGQYKVVDLRTGVYTVSFTLAGFNGVRREGIELSANFTAPVNAELKVGAVAETVTVSGASPLVDVQNATVQQVMTSRLLETVPMSRSIWGVAQTIVGVVPSGTDVGGSGNMQQRFLAVHGSETRDNAFQVDGLSISGLENDGAFAAYHNEGAAQEIVYQTSGMGTEIHGAGVRMNFIPKEGGNAFKTWTLFNYENGSWASDNTTDGLRARGLQAGSAITKNYDVNLGLGGPIVRNKVWFFGSYRRNVVDQNIPNAFYSLEPQRADGRLVYRPDLSRQVIDNNWIWNPTGRVTMQLAQNQKLSAYYDKGIKYKGNECAGTSTQEACTTRTPKLYYNSVVKYTASLSNRLLLEAGLGANELSYSWGEPQLDVLPTAIPRRDLLLATAWSAKDQSYQDRHTPHFAPSVTMTYVSGSHAFRTGFQYNFGTLSREYNRRGIDLVQEYRNGIPSSVTVYNTPLNPSVTMKYDMGIHVSDTWTIRRFTITPGVRFDLLNAYIDEQTAPVGRFVPARTFPRIDDLPNWKDVAPRVGAALDLFGNGKTAIRGSVGRFMRTYKVGFAETYNPMIEAPDQRTWTDRNEDSIAQDSEIGPSNNSRFGQLNRFPDPDIQRPYQWEYTAGIQHEVAGGVSVSLNWMRRQFRQIIWTQNRALSISDYTPVSIPNPLDPSDMLTVYNLAAAKLGQSDLIDRNSDQNTNYYTAFDLGFTARGRGATVFGGASFGKQVSVTCQVDNPNSLRYCDQSVFGMPYRSQYKMSGTYALPFSVDFSGSFQSQAGGFSGYTPLNVNYLVNRTIIPTLNQTSVNVQLIQPGTKWLPTLHQLDLRIAKRFKVGRATLRAQVDAFNVTNSNTILGMTQTFGPALDRVTSILAPRIYQVGVNLDF